MIDEKIRNKKLHYDINRAAAKISTLLSVEIDKHEYLADEEILPQQQHRILEDTNIHLFTT